jgi:hypothetical protein
MTRRKALERWGTKVVNSVVAPQELWSIAKSLMKRDGTKAPTAVEGSVGITYHPNEKVNQIADCLEKQFTSHDLFNKNDERQMETRVEALLASVDDTPFEKVRPCDVYKKASSLTQRKACGLDGIPNECLRHLPRKPLVYLTHLCNRCLRLSHFPKPWKEAKVITLPKPGKGPKFPKNLHPIGVLSTTGKLFEKVILKIVLRHNNRAY